MLLGARFWMSGGVGHDEEDIMYKELWENYFKNTSGYDFDISNLFPYDGEIFTLSISGYISNGQIFRYNKFKTINLGNVRVQATYGFQSTTLTTVHCGQIGNVESTFNGCTALNDVFCHNQTTTQMLALTGVFKTSPTVAVNKVITWHGSDGKKINWDDATSSWVVTDDL